jgi:hypothetical protein
VREGGSGCGDELRWCEGSREMKSDKEDALYGCWQELRVCCFLDRRHIVAIWLALTSNYMRTKTSLRFSVDKVETVKKYIAILSGEADHLLHSSSSPPSPEYANLPNDSDCNQSSFSQKHFYTTSSTRINLAQSTPSSKTAHRTTHQTNTTTQHQ